MAFVFKAERFNDKQIQDEIGPGAYDLRKEADSKPGYAPFGSTAPRYRLAKEEKEKHGKKRKDQKEDIRKLEEENGRTDILSQFDPKLIDMSKPMGVFKSQTRRFESKNILETPGPGMYATPGFTDNINKAYHYKQQIEIGRKQKEEQLEKLGKIKGNKLVVPSIPTRDRAFGYTVGKDGGFKINKPKESETIDDKKGVGPGQYDIPSEFDPQYRKGVM